MAPKTVFPSSPLSLEAIKLGRLVLNTRYPQQDYIDPSTEVPKFTKTPLHDFEEVRSLALLSLSFENRDDYIVDFSAAKSFTYLLDNSKAWFARACGAPESRTWLEHAIEHADNVYLVVGYHTLVDARVTERSRISEVLEMDKATGINAYLPRRMNRYMPCKVKFSWYSSRKVEKGFLEPNNRWKPCLGVRGEVPTGIDDVVDVEINEGDEDEDEDQDEDMDEDEDEDEDEDDGEDEEDGNEEKSVRPVGGKSNKVTENNPNQQQAGARVQCSSRPQSQRTSWGTTISLMLQMKDPTHRERGAWVQAGRLSVKYSTAADQRHVLLVYTGSKYTTKFEDVIGGGEGPTEIISWRWGWLPIWWSYHVWVFKSGDFELQSDGGCVYMLFLSAFSRNFYERLIDLDAGQGCEFLLGIAVV
ncbi:hypothetical protein P167DRAFT_609394 [Morchella conica CCBAS932]|uniref:Uncharacterized protein n=1 Tax=Morchella conica CCBAS932 TaxID=1392247 RepID=A0A3N4KAK4_9PEZI|nr:hypothetical protein P167DRAFT_609394 [Morchella conica CCBAS932]